MNRPLLLAAALILAAGCAIPARAGNLDQPLLRRAARGDVHALHHVFVASLSQSGTEETNFYEANLKDLFELVGPGPFVRALRREPVPIQRRVAFYLNAAMSHP